MVRLLLLIICATYPVVSVSAEEGVVEWQGRLSIPLAETVNNVAGWMKNSGLTVDEKRLPGNIVILSGTGDEGRHGQWRIELSQHSALGTRVSIEAAGSQEAKGRLSELTDLLQSSESGDWALFNSSTPVIPEAILNQIGNVACIHVQTRDKSIQFSGFFIAGEGLVLCTAHDLREHEQVKILTNTGIFYQGDIIKADFERDLALIAVEAVKEEKVSVSEGRNLLGMGETVFSIGCPMNLRGTIQTGHINGPPRKVENVVLWQVNMHIQPGSSGSPVFDASGAFVGVVKGRHREAEDIGFIIPLEVVVDFLRGYFSS